MNSDITERGPLTFTDGPVALAVGSEPTVTRWEIVGHPYSERVPMAAIQAALQAAGAGEDAVSESVASLFVDDSANAAGGVEKQPDDPETRALLLESAALIWQLRIQDIAAVNQPLHQEAVNHLGRLDIAGEPLLNELLAQRRKEPATDDQEFAELKGVVDALRKNIVFGAAGLAAAEPATVPELAQQATAADGWVPKVGLLVAAEECLSADLLARARVSRAAGQLDAAELAVAMQLVLDNRREDLALVRGLEELSQQLAKFATGRFDQLRQRTALKRLAQIEAVITPFMTMRRGSGTGEIMDTATGDLKGSGEQAAVEFDEQALAAALGERFERAVPVARERVAELKRRYSGAGNDQLAAALRRRFHDEAAGKVIEETEQEHDLLDLVALYAMSLAILREVPVGDPARRKVYARTVSAMVKALGVSKTVQESPMLKAALRFAQRQLMEFLFIQLGTHRSGLGKVGVDQKGFKSMRSKIWGARVDPEIIDLAGNALHGGMVRLLAAGINQTMR